MSSYLDFEGVYSKTKRYMVHNWSPEDFIQHFGEESVYNDTNVITTHPAYDLRINAGEMRELGQFEAYIVTKHFVNREIMREAMKVTGKERERIEMSMNNKDVRKPYEDKTLKEIIPGEATPFMDELKAKMRSEILAETESSIKKEDKIEMPKVEGQKFCDYCDSKGGRHKANCTRPKSTAEFGGI